MQLRFMPRTLPDPAPPRIPRGTLVPPSGDDRPWGATRDRPTVTSVTAVPIDETTARRGDVVVSDVMTRLLVTVRPDESLFAAWELLSRGDIHHLPVVSAGRCVAVVDDRMVAGAIASPLVTRRRTVAEVMPQRVHCVLPSTPLRRVAGIMRLEGTTAVPVVDEHRRLLGLVTDRDLVAAVADHGVALSLDGC
jgi:CBS domain-containing protein